MTETEAAPAVAHPAVTYPELLRERAARQPERTAIDVAGVTRLSYGEWDDRADRAAAGLRSRGVRPGDRVGLHFGGLEWIEYAIAYYAVMRARAAAVHLETAMPPAELCRRAAETGLVGIVGGATPAPETGTGAWHVELAALAAPPDGPDGPDDRAPGDPPGDPEADDVCDVLYTCGTSGPATGLTVTHGNLMALQARRKMVDDVPRQEHLLAPMPVCTTPGQGVVGLALISAATLMVTLPDEAETVAELVERYRIGSVLMTPALAVGMVSGRVHERHDLTSVHTLATSSAPFPAAIATRLLAAMPNARLAMAYGAVQGVPAVFWNTYDPAHPRRLGRPAPGTEGRILGPSGEPVPRGEVGVVWVRAKGPRRVMLDPEIDRRFFAGGWCCMDDLGYEDDDGQYHLVDRVSDMVRVDGELLSTVELEGLLYQHPAVREGAAVGVPDPVRGQAVVAVVALDEPDSLAGVRAFVDERLPPVARPARVLTVDAVPRNSLGKVVKRELRRAVAADVAAGGRGDGVLAGVDPVLAAYALVTGPSAGE